MNRINYEINNIKKEKPDYYFIYHIPDNYYKKDNKNTSICFHLIKEFFDITIILEKNYPFTPPHILFNYKSLPHIYLNNECLYCNSLLCSSSYYPGIKIVQLINDLEILINNNYKQEAKKSIIYFKLLPNEIKNKILSFI